MQLYLDEDAVRGGLITALRLQGVTMSTALEESTLGLPDEGQLAFATERDWVIYSYNVRDFCRLHKEWIASGRAHSGIILAHQQQYSIGEQLRRILRLRSELSTETMRNRLEFLTSWGD